MKLPFTKVTVRACSGYRVQPSSRYRTLVLAPDSVQEMCDLTLAAFDLADEYRNPVVVLADAYIGQMMEPVAFPDRAVRPPMPAYAVAGTAESRANLASSIYLEPDLCDAGF